MMRLKVLGQEIIQMLAMKKEESQKKMVLPGENFRSIRISMHLKINLVIWQLLVQVLEG